MRLRDFKVLSFDCYGTLVDWESGLMAAYAPLLARASAAGLAVTRDQLLESHARHEAAQQSETPAMAYPRVLAAVHGRVAKEWSLATTAAEDSVFGDSVGDWPAFADSASALQYLQQHFHLAILSNVDRASFMKSQARLGVVFDSVNTAQDIGSYKPDPDNFAFLLARLDERGFDKAQILHVAESLYHDHRPANNIGLASAWIYRRHAQQGFGATLAPSTMPRFDFRFNSLAELAEAHRDEMRT